MNELCHKIMLYHNKCTSYALTHNTCYKCNQSFKNMPFLLFKIIKYVANIFHRKKMLQVMSWHIKSIQMETHGNATIVIKSHKLGHKKII